ncbi:MAG: formylglycine-generating enzyme family protein [Planctomycetota bacterium]
MADALQLESLLRDLRARGFRIGELEYRRLKAAFACAPPPPAEQLRAVVRAAVVHRQGDAQAFENAFRAWLLKARAALGPGAEPQPEVGEAEPPGPPRGRSPRARAAAAIAAAGGPRRRRWPRRLAMLAVVSVLSLAVWWSTRSDEQKPKPNVGGTRQPGGAASPPPEPKRAPDGILAQVAVHRLEPVGDPVPRAPAPARGAWLFLALAGAASAAAIWLVYRRRVQNLEPEPKRSARVARDLRARPETATATRAHLLDRDSANELVFGVERFVADEFIDVLDLDATVAATARGAGIPELHYQKPLHDRAVWLWCDDALASRAARRLVLDTQARLAASGLAVERATFWRSPEVLVHDDHSRTSPLALEGQRDGAIVAVVTDGSGLAARLDDGRTERRTRDLLRGLATWPRLALVTPGATTGATEHIGATYGLEVVELERIGDFLGASPSTGPEPPVPVRPIRLTAAHRRWAMALALGDATFGDDVAWALHGALALDCPRLDLDRVVAQATGRARGWAFDRGPLRVELLDDLARTVPRTATGAAFAMPGDSTLGRTLAFWRARLPAHDDVPTRFRRAWFDLWDRPAAAADTLEALARTGHRDSVRALLRDFMDRRDRDAALDRHGIACLPWPADAIGLREAFRRLAVLGLGEAVLAFRPPHMPTAVRAALFGALAFGALGAFRAATGSPVDRAAAAYRVDGETPLGCNIKRGDATTALWRGQDDVGQVALTPGALRTLRWHQQELPNPDARMAGVAVYRAGRSTPTGPAARASSMALSVLLVHDADSAPGRDWVNFAAELLDRGTVDVAVLGSDRGAMQPWLDQKRTQVAVVDRANVTWTGQGPAWAVLRAIEPRVPRELGSELRPLRELWPDAIVSGVGEGTVAWAARERLRTQTIDLGHGVAMELTRVPAGTFRLGSPTAEEGRYADEGPIEGVTVNSFWIARTETTRAQWRAVMDQWPSSWAANKSDGALPATGVSWLEAVKFCNELSRREGLTPTYNLRGESVTWNRPADGYRLPVEAEWEYACRARTTTRYPWGDDGSDDALTAHAWWHENTALEPQPVATKPPNAWGLHDMIGNAYEWCWDGFKNTHDPRGRDEVGEGRVVRGGSFVVLFDARYLRSAYRNGFAPSDRNFVVGFRCVRAPHRQH